MATTKPPMRHPNPARHEAAFGFWWGRYVMGLTDEAMAAGAASPAAERAAEAAWAASGYAFSRALDELDDGEYDG